MFNGELMEPVAPEEEFFRPFTVDEVSRITGVWTPVFEGWLRTWLPLKLGDDGSTQGLEYMQCFAVFVGRAWLEGGADRDRAGRVVRFVSSVTLSGLATEFARGNTFPQVSDAGPKVLVRRPTGKLGRDLNLRTLHDAFKAGLAQVFPKG